MSQRVINFSGGLTSALMTLREYRDGDIVLFTDTTWEHPGTYDFIELFQKNEGIQVSKAVYTNPRFPGLQGFPAYIAYKMYCPSVTKRTCTEELKIVTAKRYLRSLGLISFSSMVGFRADEHHRVIGYRSQYKRASASFPLYRDGIVQRQVLDYWNGKSYNLNIPSILGNCDLCFLKGKAAIIRIMQVYPDLADKWIKAEQYVRTKRKKASFIPGVTYEQLMNVAKTQKTLFDLGNMLPAFSCSCTT